MQTNYRLEAPRPQVFANYRFACPFEVKYLPIAIAGLCTYWSYFK